MYGIFIWPLVIYASFATGPQMFYLHDDHLGSPTITTNTSGGIVETADYYPYGTLKFDTPTGTFKEPRKFLGEEYDPSTGFSYLNARYYDGERGQFLSQDPTFLSIGDEEMLSRVASLVQSDYLSDPQSHNSYSYAAGNPVTRKDPTGKFLLQALLAWAIPTVAGDPAFTDNGTIAPTPQQSRFDKTLLFVGLGTPTGIVKNFTEHAAARAAQIAKNAAQGARREAEMLAELQAKYPNAEILRQPYLRDASGAIGKDLSGAARRIDFAVVQNNQILERIEVTSMTANKRLQQAKEIFLIQKGVTYIRNSSGLLNFAESAGGVTTPATVIRRPRRKTARKKRSYREIFDLLEKDPNLFLYNFGNMIHHYKYHTIPGLSEWELNKERENFFVLLKFLQDHALVSRRIVDLPKDVDGSGEIRAKDFTQRGLKFAALPTIEKYLAAIDRGTAAEKARKTILERDLKKLKENNWSLEQLEQG